MVYRPTGGYSVSKHGQTMTEFPCPEMYVTSRHHSPFGCREGFSVLFYGFGSKRRLLEGLAREHFTDGGIVAFSGFVPTLTAREVLTRVATLLRTPRSPLPTACMHAHCRCRHACMRLIKVFKLVVQMHHMLVLVPVIRSQQVAVFFNHDAPLIEVCR